jgi:hypothetical protein
MAPIPLLLMCFAFVCFAFAVLPAAEARRAQLVPLGLALWCLTLILGYAGVVGR